MTAGSTSSSVTLYSTNPVLTRRAVDVLPSGARTSRGWDAFATAGAPGCGVVIVEWLERDGAVARLRSHRRRNPLRPLVLVTSGHPANARHLASIVVEEVVWTDEIETRLPGAVREATGRAGLHRLRRALASDRRLPAEIREALLLLLESPTVIVTQTDLARVVGCHRATLARQWRSATRQGQAAGTLKDVLDWVALARAAIRKSPGASWAGVAEELGMAPDTFARICRRTAGKTPGSLRAGDRLPLLEGFLAGVVRPLFEQEAIPPLATLVPDLWDDGPA